MTPKYKQIYTVLKKYFPNIHIFNNKRTRFSLFPDNYHVMYFYSKKRRAKDSFSFPLFILYSNHDVVFELESNAPQCIFIDIIRREIENITKRSVEVYFYE